MRVERGVTFPSGTNPWRARATAGKILRLNKRQRSSLPAHTALAPCSAVGLQTRVVLIYFHIVDTCYILQMFSMQEKVHSFCWQLTAF